MTIPGRQNRSKFVQWTGLVAIGGLTALAAAIGAFASVAAPDFYADLVRPEWAPPAWVFGPVWSVLYLLMAVAAWIVWLKGGEADIQVPLLLYSGQLVLNALWTWLFFHWRLGAWAGIDIFTLWLILVFTIFRFRRISKTAAALLVPYLAWVSFAAVLAITIWRFNLDRL